MPKRTRNYDASLIEALRKTEEASAYLQASAECEPSDPDAKELQKIAESNVSKAQGHADADGWIETAKELPEHCQLCWIIWEFEHQPMKQPYRYDATGKVFIWEHKFRPLQGVTHWQPVRVPPPKKERA